MSLVTLAMIDSVSKIPGANIIDHATVRVFEGAGRLVSIAVRKDDFRAGDPCIFYDVDSMLPVKDYPFLKNNKNIIMFEGGIIFSCSTAKCVQS